MSFKDMLNASAIQAENERLKEENIKLKKKLEELGYDDFMEIKKVSESLKREIDANKRILSKLDAHVEELNNRSNELDEQINQKLKQMAQLREASSKN